MNAQIEKLPFQMESQEDNFLSNLENVIDSIDKEDLKNRIINSNDTTFQDLQSDAIKKTCLNILRNNECDSNKFFFICISQGLDNQIIEIFKNKEIKKLKDFKYFFINQIQTSNHLKVFKLFKDKELSELKEFNYSLRDCFKNNLDTQVLRLCLRKGQNDFVNFYNNNKITNNLDNEIVNLFKDEKIVKFKEIDNILKAHIENNNTNKIFTILQNNGLLKIDKFYSILEEYIENKTFQEFYEILKYSLFLKNFKKIYEIFSCKARNLIEKNIFKNIKIEYQIIFNETIDNNFFQNIQSMISQFDSAKLQFVDLFIRKNGFFNKKILNIFRGGKFALEIEKTGSKLMIYRDKKEKDGNIRITNQISAEAAQAWKKAVKNKIPVASYYDDWDKDNNQKLVFSRFCGLSLRSLDIKDKKLRKEIKQQKENIFEKLNDNSINHGHDHDGNFTVEFVKKDYYQKYQDNINVMPFKDDEEKAKQNDNPIIFDVDEYLKNRDQYEVVVRLIDWDQATSN